MPLDAALRSIPLFSQLREEDLERLARAARDRHCPRDTVIAFEDDPGDALYVIMRGRIKVVLTSEDGREVILSTRGKGEFFGEMSLIDDEPRSAHVIAMEDSELLVLRREDFLSCVEEMPGIAVGVLRSLCRRLRRADDLIGGLVLLDVPGRVARLLLQLADENDGTLVTRDLTHHTIAQMIGSSRETVSRTLRSFANQDIIETARRSITIKNREALEVAAGKETLGRVQPPAAVPETPGDRAQVHPFGRRRTDPTGQHSPGA